MKLFYLIQERIKAMPSVSEQVPKLQTFSSDGYNQKELRLNLFL